MADGDLQDPYERGDNYDDMAKSKETALYPAVKRWFQQERHCSSCVADLPRDLKVRLPRNLKIREIDVVALEPTAWGRPLVHLAEGKRFASGESLAACVNQADSVRAAADYVWVFFPKSDWEAVEAKQRVRNEEHVKSRDMGLLLVQGRSCEVIIEAPRNKAVDEEEAMRVFEALDESPMSIMPTVDQLGASEAVRAASTMALVSAVEEVVSSVVNCDDWTNAHNDSEAVRRGFYVRALETETLYLELDPWGCYLRNGSPVLWFWAELTSEQLLNALGGGRLIGTHCYFPTGRWNWHMVPTGDLSPQTANLLLKENVAPDEDHPSIALAVPITGRRRDALARDIKGAASQFGRWKP